MRPESEHLAMFSYEDKTWFVYKRFRDRNRRTKYAEDFDTSIKLFSHQERLSSIQTNTNRETKSHLLFTLFVVRNNDTITQKQIISMGRRMGNIFEESVLIFSFEGIPHEHIWNKI